jgi:hypothetical protein
MATRIESTILELDVDKCANVYGTAPCTAAGTTKCYNTYKTCQDQANFVRTTQTIKFTGLGSPIPVGQVLRPYIADLSIAPTELDVTKGLASRSSTTVRLVDEAAPDRDFDPYIATRAAAAQGTFWRRLLARNNNLVGRPARVDRAFVDGTGIRGTGTVERFIIEAVKGPDGRGEISLSLKDPIKLADRAKAPTPSTGKLAVALGTQDMQLTLESGAGASYDATGYVRVGKEVIRYDGNSGDVLSWSSSTYRATWGTEVDEGAVGDLVQQCLHYDGVHVWEVLQDLLNRAGIADTYLDLTGFELQDDTWLKDDYLITTLISDPVDISQLLRELCEQTMGVLWWSATEQLVKYLVILPQSPAATTVALTDDANLIEDSVSIERQDNERLTFVAMYFSLIKATDDATKPASYRLGEAFVDTSAESVNEYGDRRTKVMTSRWFTAANQFAMRALVRRILVRYRDPPRLIGFSLDPKDDSVAEGDLRDITHPMLTDETGAPTPVRALVTRRTRAAEKADFRAIETNFNRRYAFIAPDATPNFPSNNGYACVCETTGLMSDGGTGYLVI